MIDNSIHAANFMKQESGEGQLHILLGNPEKCSLESRVLNAATFSSMVICILSALACVTFHLTNDYFVLAVISSGVFSLLYGIGRRNGNHIQIAWFYLIVNYIIIFYDWLFIGGYSGISLSIALVLACILPILLKGKQLVAALVSTFCLVTDIYAVEMTYPEYMIQNIHSIQYLTQRFVSIIILGAGLSLLVSLVMSSYRFQQEKIRLLTLTDELTNLYNRRFFNQMVNKEINRARRDCKYISLLMIDIDDFKKYNDTYGHHKGDCVLTCIGELLIKTASRASDFAFRLGGEEFAVLFSGLDPGQAKAFSEKIREKIEDLKIEHKQNVSSTFVTVSMGLTTQQPESEMDMQWFYEISDQALYMAKKNGKNQIATIYGIKQMLKN